MTGEGQVDAGDSRAAADRALALTRRLASRKVPVDHPAAALVVDSLLTLAETSPNGGVWLDRVFRLHTAKGWIMTPSAVKRIQTALDQISQVPGSGLRDYEARLRAMSGQGRRVSARLMVAISEMLDVCSYGTMVPVEEVEPRASRACLW
ncbi:hypothetical protein [Enhygromyxa salina]|uniref:hypothetical protein n=1 Tax=Enhygromyxa salina TaxID=215803 RepID=UPI0011B26D4C|nr:hypothetical protein [Enhygromyxa salina]